MAHGPDEGLVDRLSGDCTDADDVVDDLVRQRDRRLDLIEIDRPPNEIRRVVIGILRHEAIDPVLAKEIEQNVVRLEDGELGVQLGSHGRQGPPGVETQVGERRTTEFNVVSAVVAVLAGDVEETDPWL